jgi:hypothetical protein
MRVGIRNLATAVLWLAAGCSGSEPTDLSARLGCGEIGGLAAVTGEGAPLYVLIGEHIETKEAPAAFAELACRIAARQPKDQPLWVGLPDYIGGTTEAVQAMRKRLGELVDKGAPMVVAEATKAQTIGSSRREDAERIWANDIMRMVEAAGAGRALLLLPRRDAVLAQVIPDDRRIEAYAPMGLFLGDQVLNLEIGRAPNIGEPTIRIYLKPADGYMGQFAIATLTPAQKAEPSATGQ